jgi:hypothetical protein
VFRFLSRGDFKSTEDFLKKAYNLDVGNVIDRLAQEGVHALAAMTPRDSGIAASSWAYRVHRRGKQVTITWTNSNVESGFPVVVALQYGYATGTGGYVQGRDYINPAMSPIFDRIAEEVWKAVTSR